MKELTIGFLLETNKGSHIDEDLLLVNNIADLPRSNEPGRLDFLFFGMCTSGVGKYSLNTIDYVVLPKVNPTKRNVTLLQNEMCKFNISFYIFLHPFYLMFNNILT